MTELTRRRMIDMKATRVKAAEKIEAAKKELAEAHNEVGRAWQKVERLDALVRHLYGTELTRREYWFIWDMSDKNALHGSEDCTAIKSKPAWLQKLTREEAADLLAKGHRLCNRCGGTK